MEKRLLIGSILSIVGGVLILACGTNCVLWTLTDFENLLDFLSKFIPQSSVEYWEGAGPTALAIWYVIFGIVFGVLVTLSGACGGLGRKGKIEAWGIITIVLSVLSVSSGGGF